MPKRYTNPAFFDEGMTVYVQWNSTSRVGVRCRVVTAMGDSARVVNEARGIDRIVSRWDVFTEVVPEPLPPDHERTLLSMKTFVEEVNRKRLFSPFDPPNGVEFARYLQRAVPLTRLEPQAVAHVLGVNLATYRRWLAGKEVPDAMWAKIDALLQILTRRIDAIEYALEYVA